MQPETSSDHPTTGRDTEICSKPPEGCFEETEHPSGSYRAVGNNPTTNLRNRISAGLAELIAQEDSERNPDDTEPDTERNPHGLDETTDIARPPFDPVTEEKK
jgi:hypothetical protein